MNSPTINGTPTQFQVDTKNELTNGPIAANSYAANGNMTVKAYDQVGDVILIGVIIGVTNFFAIVTMAEVSS